MRETKKRPCLSKLPLLMLWALSMFILLQGVCPAQIYKYKDEQGRWHYTDKPVESAEALESAHKNTRSLGKNLEQELYEKFKPKSDIEKASLATVTIQTSLGLGSGFFISDEGYILTNKHVLQVNEDEIDKKKQEIKDFENQIKDVERNLDIQWKQLREYKKDLDEYRQYLDALPASQAKQREEEKYGVAFQRYLNWKKDLDKRERNFNKQKRDFQKSKSSFSWKTNVARLSRNFTIVLKDGAELNAHLISFSRQHDLALLKLDGYKTPFIKSASLDKISQGMQVYTIGSPLGLRDSVTSGVLTGFSGDYVKTDAAIFPGNSGGPLITPRGNVIGVNTMKVALDTPLNPEGFGIAISFDVAIKEFEKFLPKDYPSER